MIFPPRELDGMLDFDVPGAIPALKDRASKEQKLAYADFVKALSNNGKIKQTGKNNFEKTNY